MGEQLAVQPPQISGRRRLDAVGWLDLAVKALLLVLLVGALLWPDLSGLKGKATTARLIIYPLGALAVPLWYWAYGRRRRERYPWTADLLITSPWLLDMVGNRFNLFDTVGWWDDAMHFVNWALLTAGVLIAFIPRDLSRGLYVLVALGFGATAALCWELGEYVAFVRHSAELQTAYTDTLGDLTLGTAGSLVAALIVYQILHRRSIGGHADHELRHAKPVDGPERAS